MDILSNVIKKALKFEIPVMLVIAVALIVNKGYIGEEIKKY